MHLIIGLFGIRAFSSVDAQRIAPVVFGSSCQGRCLRIMSRLRDRTAFTTDYSKDGNKCALAQIIY